MAEGATAAGVETFEAGSLGEGLKGFSGVAACGDALVFAPLNNGAFHGRALRHDRRGGFADKACWQAFDCAALDPEARGFTDALACGGHAYLVPFFNGAHHGTVVRHDGAKDFGDASAWECFDITALEPRARGFVSGVAHDGVVYLAPYQLDLSTTNGMIARHDQRHALSDPAGWAFFDATRVHADCRGFHSAVADGEGRIYFVPYLREGRDYGGRILRHDPRLPFSVPEAWESFDLTTLDPRFRGYVGGCLAGGALYLAPYFDGTDRHGRVLRFDTGQALGEAAAWQSFDCAGLDPGCRGFFGALSDGRHLYLVPHCRGVGGYHGQVTRCDLSLAFTETAAWSFHALEQEHPMARGFIGGALRDGFLYLAPFETDAGRHSGLFARIDTHASDFWRVT